MDYHWVRRWQLISSFLIVCLSSCVHVSSDVVLPIANSILAAGVIDVIDSDALQVSGSELELASVERLLSLPSDLAFTSTPTSQVIPGTANGVSGRFLRTSVRVENTSEVLLSNITFLA
ncbi:MAG: hypothetical protein AAF267_25205, partial [Deinococcota bacterium]